MSELDRDVAEALGMSLDDKGFPYAVCDDPDYRMVTPEAFTPSTNWQQAGELLEEYKICIQILKSGIWNAAATSEWNDKTQVFAESPQEAICKAVIALKESENE